jgi:hypothetical protein
MGYHIGILKGIPLLGTEVSIDILIGNKAFIDADFNIIAAFVSRMVHNLGHAQIVVSGCVIGL